MKRWIKITLTVVLFIAMTVALYLIGFKGEWIKPIVEKAGVFGYIIYILIQIVITTLMTFVPATTFTFTLIAAGLFGPVTGFIISAIACFLSSMLMFFIGDKLGEPFVDWLIGKESRIKAQDLVSARATVLVPVMLACPFFPDDAICMVAGMTKMKYWYFAIVAATCRTIGVGVTTFLGGDVLNYAAFSLLDWFLFINILIIDALLVWKLSTKVEQWINKKKQLKNKEDKDETDMPTLSD
jgi:uncharacterized membrane protein YdjX (TVP38/TMEM64 family)